METLRILGIDPGTATTGFGVVDRIGSTPKMLDYGVITTPPRLPIAERLLMIYNDLNQLLEAFKPNVVVMERLFFAKNQTTFIAVGKSTGVMQLAAAQKGIEVVEYTPPEIKQAVTGEGNAEKHQVQYMIQRILSIKEIPKPDDAADALAICICHAHSERLKNAK